MSKRTTIFKPSRGGGFSLVEMLVVMGILAALVALALPAFTSLSQGNALTRGGRELANALILGREEAMARNRKISFRLIQLPEGPNGALQYRMAQLWMAKDDAGTMAPYGNVIRLPSGVALAESANLSPLLQASPANSGTMQFGGKDYPYISFVITANGALDSTIPATSSYLTLVQAKDAGVTTAPANFFSIFLNPVTGKVSSYRP